MKTLDNFNAGGGNSVFPGQKTDKRFVRLSLNGGSSYFHLYPVPVGARHLILGGLGLKVDL